MIGQAYAVLSDSNKVSFSLSSFSPLSLSQSGCIDGSPIFERVIQWVLIISITYYPFLTPPTYLTSMWVLFVLLIKPCIVPYIVIALKLCWNARLASFSFWPQYTHKVMKTSIWCSVYGKCYWCFISLKIHICCCFNGLLQWKVGMHNIYKWDDRPVSWSKWKKDLLLFEWYAAY